MLSRLRVLQRSPHPPVVARSMSWFSSVLGGGAPTAPPEEKAQYPADVCFEDGPVCTGCDNPCSAHKQIPDYLKIDTESPLLGSVKPYKRHVLFQTPGRTASNWPPNLEAQEGGLAAELSAAAKNAGEQLGYRVLVTAVDIAQQAEGGTEDVSQPQPLLMPNEALVLPDLVALGPLTADTARSILEEYLATGQAAPGASLRHLAAWRAASPSLEPPSASAAAATPEPPSGLAACVLVCAHKLRDKRCGVAGPMLIEELEKACKVKGLQDQVAVWGCSHVGGHKFAGNIVVYGAAGGHWYGRVKPCHAEAIIDTHVVQGRVFKELWRGRMES